VAGEFRVDPIILRFRLLGVHLGKAVFSIVVGIMILGNLWCQIVAGVIFIVYGVLLVLMHFVAPGQPLPERREEERRDDLPAFTGVDEPMTSGREEPE
jgi:hypothetical protein